MDASLNMQAISLGLITYLLIAITLCLRAYAQAWMANRLGDDTPAREGRLTLNPLPHVDFFGTVLLPLLFIFYLQPRLDKISFFLAWTKPVPINPANFEKPRKHYLFTLLASTGMSVILMAVAAIAAGLFIRNGSDLYAIPLGILSINAIFIVLDLIPLPPLPGALIFVQMGWMKEETYHNIARWGGLALLLAFQLPPVRVALSVLQAIVATPALLLTGLIAG